MSYLDVAEIRDDGHIARRVMACVAVEDISAQPGEWVAKYAWVLAAQPGWADAWAYAKANHAGDDDYRPGRDGGVITDGMILSAVQAIHASETQPEEPVE